MTVIDTADDMTWLAETIPYAMAADYAIAIVHGNEDCPDKVELFRRNDYQCSPRVLERNDDETSEHYGRYAVTSFGE